MCCYVYFELLWNVQELRVPMAADSTSSDPDTIRFVLLLLPMLSWYIHYSRDAAMCATRATSAFGRGLPFLYPVHPGYPLTLMSMCIVLICILSYVACGNLRPGSCLWLGIRAVTICIRGSATDGIGGPLADELRRHSSAH